MDSQSLVCKRELDSFRKNQNDDDKQDQAKATYQAEIESLLK